MTAVARSKAGSLEGWIALYTKPRQENVAIVNIERQGFEVYCPTIIRTRRHARKVEQVRRPLFPAYVFVRLNEQKFQWRPLLSTHGVQSVVRFRDKLGFMPRGFVEDLRANEIAGNLQQMAAPEVIPGMRVKMMDGPFESLIAEVLSLPEKDRVWLLLDIMGRQVRIQQDIWSIECK
jgi:transcriptional antiterminator RfaH